MCHCVGARVFEYVDSTTPSSHRCGVPPSYSRRDDSSGVKAGCGGSKRAVPCIDDRGVGCGIVRTVDVQICSDFRSEENNYFTGTIGYW